MKYRFPYAGRELSAKARDRIRQERHERIVAHNQENPSVSMFKWPKVRK